MQKTTQNRPPCTGITKHTVLASSEKSELFELFLMHLFEMLTKKKLSCCPITKTSYVIKNILKLVYLSYFLSESCRFPDYCFQKNVNSVCNSTSLVWRTFLKSSQNPRAHSSERLPESASPRPRAFFKMIPQGSPQGPPQGPPQDPPGSDGWGWARTG